MGVLRKRIGQFSQVACNKAKTIVEGFNRSSYAYRNDMSHYVTIKKREKGYDIYVNGVAFNTWFIKDFCKAFPNGPTINLEHEKIDIDFVNRVIQYLESNGAFEVFVEPKL